MAQRSDETLMVRRNGVLVISQHAAAEFLGVTTQTLIRWSKEPDAPPRTDDGWYPVREIGLWARKVMVTKQSKVGSANPIYSYAPEGWGPKPKALPPVPRGDNDAGVAIPEDLKAAERRYKAAQADKIEMEMAVSRGELILAADVMHAWQLILVRVKTRLLKLPTTLAPLIIGDPDLYSVQNKLKEGVADALSEASVDWRETQQASDDDE